MGGGLGRRNGQPVLRELSIVQMGRDKLKLVRNSLQRYCAFSHCGRKAKVTAHGYDGFDEATKRKQQHKDAERVRLPFYPLRKPIRSDHAVNHEMVQNVLRIVMGLRAHHSINSAVIEPSPQRRKPIDQHWPAHDFAGIDATMSNKTIYEGLVGRAAYMVK